MTAPVDTHDYAITIKVRNNRFLQKMRENGYKSGLALARASGVSQTVISSYLRMAQRPVLARKNFEWGKNILVLSGFLHCLPEDLFPAAHVRKPLLKSEATFTANAADLDQISASLRSMSLPSDEKMMITESKCALDKLIGSLDQRPREIVEKRFGLNGYEEHTFEKLAKEYNVGKERIRQIERKALRNLKGKLRHSEVVSLSTS